MGTTEEPYLFGMADAARLPLSDRSIDLVFGSPPYLDARTYGIGAQRKCQPWIDWMLAITEEACRVSRGLVLWVVAGAVRGKYYQPAPEGLLYEWWKRGGQCWRPAYWYRQGIPGSGQQHWLRADVEYVLAFLGSGRVARRGRPATHLRADRDFGSGGSIEHGPGGAILSKKKRLINPQDDDFGEPAPNDPNAFWTDNTAMGKPPKKSFGKHISTYQSKGDLAVDNERIHKDSVLVNPGNLIKTSFGSFGSPHAHDNEAPFPEMLAEFFIKTACQPSGIVLDPFSGSGTTVVVAERLGRRGIGLDIRRSQAEIAVRRITRPHSQRQRNRYPEKDRPLFAK